MKKTSIIWLIGIATFTIGLWNPAFGARGELDQPSVAIPTSLTEVDREKIRSVLSHDDCQFISGGWLNKSTHLHYKSETAALGKFLDALAKCPGVKVRISFYQPGPDATWAPENSNWSVFHTATDNCFSVKIRLSSDIDLTKLYVPPLKAAH
ncbi:MAG: hypothetical protein Aurels2KO_56110 [Aureliella sp.]